ncbi:putative odorant receptor 69a [Cataglyphis hispanica]|uniref:putative odorant receptor 69a n=1 Tax=Cataglyphis hispanica TaxID=1086592 RepID=UPI00217FB81A|nr:putative odorant receptor 69a [Cataglyphis hispanica]
MISIDSLHIGNRTLLLSIGLWPYQQSKLVQFQIVLLFVILTTCIIFQFTIFLTSKCTLDLFINVFSSAFFFLFLVIQYTSFCVNIKVRLLNIYNDLTDMNEINIMKKYGSYAKRYTIGLMLIFTIFAPVIILYPFWPHIPDILLSTNKSLSRPPLSGMFATEYFIDQKKYFYWILLHGYAALFLGIIALLAAGTLLIAYLQHACGLFRIASYRLEQALVVDTLRKGGPRNKNLIYMKLIRAVDMHREAMKFSDTSVSKFKVMFFFMIVVGVISASLNFFRLFQALLFRYDAEELLLPLVSVITYISYIFIGDYVGQEIIDHNNDVFATAYNIQWYAASLNIQKMVLFLLQRSTKVFSLNIAGLIVGSLEGAVSLLSTILSYFTVLYSTRT